MNGWSCKGRIIVRVQNSTWPVVLLLCSHVILLAVGAWLHSPTRDEPYHLSRGLHILATGRFDHSLGNPPLVEIVAALPLKILYPDFDFQTHRYITRDNWPDGYSVRWMFALSRWVCISFSIIGAYVCFRWATDLYGRGAGLCALSLYCFCPNMLAFGQQITCDAAAAAMGLAAAYTFWKWLLTPTWSAAWLAGVALGVAELTKLVWVLLFLLWPAAWLISLACRRTVASLRTSCWEGIQLAAILMCAIAIVNLAYAFRGTCGQLSNYPGLMAAVFNGEVPNVLRSVPLPLPKDFIGGIEAIDQELNSSHISYLRGQWKQGGWWYYYLYATTIKVPFGTLILLFVGICLSMKSWRRHFSCFRNSGRVQNDSTDPRSNWRNEVFPMSFGITLLMLESALLHSFSHHFRYALPVLPFLFLFAAKSGHCAISNRSVGAWLIGIAWLIAIFGSLCVYPHCLSFFNILANGPSGGRFCLVDSNLDWGQDLYFLKNWLKKHPEINNLELAYFGSTDPSLFDLEHQLPPRRPIASRSQGALKPGWNAISVNFVMGREGEAFDRNGAKTFIEAGSYTYFQDLIPVDRAGYSIDIYYLTPEDIHGIRDSSTSMAQNAPKRNLSDNVEK